MTDIISRAQELVKLRASMDKSNMGEVSTRTIEENMFAQTLIEALAEEDWEYTAQVFMSQRWVFMWSPRTGNSVHGKWYATREVAEKFAEQWQRGHRVRIVRRRVSPVEVIE